MASDPTTFVTGNLNLSSEYKFLDFDNMIETLVNKISRNPDKWDNIQWSFVLTDSKKEDHTWSRLNIDPTGQRWSKLPKNPLGLKSRQRQRLYMYNVNTGFWLMLYNKNTPHELIQFMKDNNHLFTHMINISWGEFSERHIQTVVTRLERNEEIKAIKMNIAEMRCKASSNLSDLST
jgi:hypothetical protein